MAVTLTDASTDNISHGSDTSLEDLAVLSVAMWIKPANVSNTYRNLCGKIDVTTPHGFLMFRPGTDGSAFRINRSRNGPTPQFALSATSTLQANAWNYIGGSINITSGGPKVIWGDLTTAVSDVTGSSSDGTGTPGTDATSNFKVGDSEGNFALTMDAALVIVWNGELSVREFEAQRLSLEPAIRISNMILFSNYFNTSFLADWSGTGNHGSQTGTANANHLPVSFRFPSILELPAAGAADLNINLSPSNPAITW